MPERPQEGEPAPEFTLATQTSDTPISLSDYRGKKAVVLYFYPKDDTPGCTTEAKDFSCLAKDFEDAGAVVIGVSPDSLASKAKFRKKHGLAVTLAADEDKAVAQAYGVWVEKSMYGKTYMGVERATFLIDRKGTIAEIWRKVKVDGHAEVVLAAAKTLKS